MSSKRNNCKKAPLVQTLLRKRSCNIMSFRQINRFLSNLENHLYSIAREITSDVMGSVAIYVVERCEIGRSFMGMTLTFQHHPMFFHLNSISTSSSSLASSNQNGNEAVPVQVPQTVPVEVPQAVPVQVPQGAPAKVQAVTEPSCASAQQVADSSLEDETTVHGFIRMLITTLRSLMDSNLRTVAMDAQDWAETCTSVMRSICALLGIDRARRLHLIQLTEIQLAQEDLSMEAANR